MKRFSPHFTYNLAQEEQDRLSVAGQSLQVRASGLWGVRSLHASFKKPGASLFPKKRNEEHTVRVTRHFTTKIVQEQFSYFQSYKEEKPL